MEPRCVLLPLRTISAPADCTRPLLGDGRNRYVRIMLSGMAERPLFRIVRRKLLYVTYPELSGPFVEFHKAIFWVGGWDPYSLPRFSKHSLSACLAAQNNKPRLSAAANKSCLKGRPLKIWSCGPAPYGCGQPVCAASTGRVLQPAPGAAVVTIMGKMQIFDAAAPFSENKPISIYARSTGRESSNRLSKLHKHRIPKGSNSTDGGTAVTNPACKPGNTTLRLFLSWDLSVSRPTNRQVQSGPRRIEVLRPAGSAVRGVLAHTSRPFLRLTDQTNYMNLPGAWVKRPGSGRSVHAVDFFITIRHHYDLRPVFRNRINNIPRGRAIFSRSRIR